MTCHAFLEVVLAEVAPRHAVYLLGNADSGHAARVVDLVARVGRAVAAVAIPGPDSIPACCGQVGSPGGGCQTGGRSGVAIDAPVVAGGAAGRPGACLDVAWRTTVIVNDNLMPRHGSFTHQPHIGASVPQVAGQVVVDRFGVGEILDEAIAVAPLCGPAVQVPLPIPSVPSAEPGRRAAQRTLRLPLSKGRRLPHVFGLRPQPVGHRFLIRGHGRNGEGLPRQKAGHGHQVPPLIFGADLDVIQAQGV